MIHYVGEKAVGVWESISYPVTMSSVMVIIVLLIVSRATGLYGHRKVSLWFLLTALAWGAVIAWADGVFN
jgi:hypothetical protein